MSPSQEGKYSDVTCLWQNPLPSQDLTLCQSIPGVYQPEFPRHPWLLWLEDCADSLTFSFAVVLTYCICFLNKHFCGISLWLVFNFLVGSFGNNGQHVICIFAYLLAYYYYYCTFFHSLFDSFASIKICSSSNIFKDWTGNYCVSTLYVQLL